MHYSEVLLNWRQLNMLIPRLFKHKHVHVKKKIYSQSWINDVQ